jgi:hypothetical protein
VTFAVAITRAQDAMRNRSQIVKPSRWQSMDVSKRAEATTHEILNFSFTAQVTTEELADLALQIQPNLPWADDHFLERVSGEALNPGKEWATWPWGNSANTFRRVIEGPRIPQQDWAYYAGLLDGDGTIYLRPQERGFSGQVIIHQKDREVLDYLHGIFKVGLVKTQGEDGQQDLNGGIYDNEIFLWQISRIEEVKWVLTNLIPFLRIKKSKAENMLRSAQDWKPTDAIGTPRQAIWDREWEPRFDHTYAERMWPNALEGGSLPLRGLRYSYGDAMDVAEHLFRAPDSRQAYLPIWFPEDTGKLDVRVPCSLGYHFIHRNGYLHCVYYIRSCDMYRHFRDDIYLTVRLQLWMLERLRTLSDTFEDGKIDWRGVKPGMFTMHITSLHLFTNDFRKLFGERKS